MTQATKYTVEQVTGSDCVDGSGRVTGPERAGHIYSTHRTREAAELALAKLSEIAPLGPPMAIFEKN